MKKTEKKGMGLRQKLFMPVLAQIVVLVVFLIVIFFALRTSKANLQETARITEMNQIVKVLKEAATEQRYMYTTLEERKNFFFRELDKLRERVSERSPMYASLDSIASLFEEMTDYKRRNSEIELEVNALAQASIAQSDRYIETIVGKLTDPRQAAGVTTLERQILISAHQNTSSAITIQKLFYQVIKDTSAGSELTDYLKQIQKNTDIAVTRLAGTPYSGMPVESQKANMQLTGLVAEYIDNIYSIRAAGLQMSNLLSSFDNDFSNQTTYLQNNTLSAVTSSFFLIGIIITLASIIVAVICTVLSIRISRAVLRATAMLREISAGEGDLTGRLDITTRDEIGDMARYFNDTMDNIESMIRTIQKESATLKEIGSDLASSMTETAAAVNQITANITGVKNQILNQAGSVTKTDETVSDIVGNIESLSNNIEDQSAGVVQSSSSVEEMTANIASVTRILEKNARAFNELMSASEIGSTKMEDVSAQIESIARESEGLIEASTVIENIADQTNLLAMNAAIEAAHAGESGKGFAVVADEIRKLAENSGVQGKSISDVLTKLKDSIDRVAEYSTSAREQFAHVVDLTKTVHEQEQVIQNAMEEQDTGSSQVLEAMRQINDVTIRVKEGSAAMLEGSREVLQEMKKLSRITDEITNSMDEMASGTGEINTSVHHVNDISKKNEESINTLSTEILRFKVGG